MASNKLLVYSQDLGGARFIGPVLKFLGQNDQLSEAFIMVHPLSQGYFHKIGIICKKLEDTVAYWRKFIPVDGLNLGDLIAESVQDIQRKPRPIIPVYQTEKKRIPTLKNSGTGKMEQIEKQ